MKASNDPMLLTVKLLLNSLYGKFGQKFKGRDNLVVTQNLTMKEIEGYDCIEKVSEDFSRVKQDTDIPPFCFPIWASYITCYARLHLYDLFAESSAIYGDTDSVITNVDLPEGTGLGELEKEMDISEGWVVRPKFYALRGEYDKIRVKGIGTYLDMEGFKKLMDGKSISYDKFVKLRESLVRGLKPGEIIEITKTLSVEDGKRDWIVPFDAEKLQTSTPIMLVDGLLPAEVLKIRVLQKKLIQDIKDKELRDLVESDFYDSLAKGDDISHEEYIENEQWGARYD